MHTKLTVAKKAVFHMALWTVFVPQSLLLFLNIRAWLLVRGEASNEEIHSALMLAAAEVVVMGLCGLGYWLYYREKLTISKVTSFIVLALHVGYLLLFTFNVGDAIPANIQPWILEEGDVGRWNYTFFMPGAFIALYGFSQCLYAGVAEKKANWIALGLTLGMPLAWYLFSTLLQPAWFGQITVSIWITTGVIFVVLFLIAIIQFIDNLSKKAFTFYGIDKHYIVAAAVGLAAPLGGLWLNRSIPFPVNFQSTGVYALTVLNGLILLFPPGGTRLLATRLFLRSVSLPFAAYFFLVFLPFLPLSLLAVVAVGLGFLMLAPLALGLFQSRVTVQDYRALAATNGSARAIAITLAGLLVLPGYFAIDALQDRAALPKTLDYFYAHDVNAAPLSQEQIHRSAQTLVQLRNRKANIQLPYLAGFYNAIVFGNMVLPDSKIAQTYQWLTNRALPEPETDRFGLSGRDQRSWRNNPTQPASQAVLDSIEHLNRTDTQHTLRLTVSNPNTMAVNQYRSEIQLPEGVFVQGLRLKIADTWEEARVFDRKTALWVYRKITEQRRDPALLYYTAPNRLELRVFPVPAKGIRELEIDFIVHSKVDGKVTIDNRTIDLNDRYNQPALISRDGTRSLAAQDYAFLRQPYLHVILDYSSDAQQTAQHYAEVIASLAETLGVTEVVVTAANIASADTDLTHRVNSHDKNALVNRITTLDLNEQSGFWLDQAIGREALKISQHSDPFYLTHRPLFVIIAGDQTPMETSVNSHQWQHLIPDLDAIRYYQNNTLRNLMPDTDATPIPVVALQIQRQVQLYPAHTSSIIHARGTDHLAVYNEVSSRFEPLPAQTPLPDNTLWTQRAALWLAWQTAQQQPAVLETERRALLTASRKTPMLLPSTALIVVESSDQWAMLERKEKQSLDNHSALAFDEEQQASEPAGWVLLVFVLFFIARKDPRILRYLTNAWTATRRRAEGVRY